MTTRSYPKVPPQHIRVLQHVSGRDGVPKVAERLQVARSVVYRLIQGKQTTVRATTLARIGSLVSTERGRTEAASEVLDFKGAMFAVMKLLKGMDPKVRREVLELCLDAYDKAEE